MLFTAAESSLSNMITLEAVWQCGTRHKHTHAHIFHSVGPAEPVFTSTPLNFPLIAVYFMKATWGRMLSAQSDCPVQRGQEKVWSLNQHFVWGASERTRKEKKSQFSPGLLQKRMNSVKTVWQELKIQFLLKEKQEHQIKSLFFFSKKHHPGSGSPFKIYSGVYYSRKKTCSTAENSLFLQLQKPPKLHCFNFSGKLENQSWWAL